MTVEAGNDAGKNAVGLNTDPSIQFGKLLAHPNPGDEIVISGVSGKYPDSKDVHHFRDNLFNKIDMISADNRRWNPGHPEIPQRTGKLLNLEKFDAGYFGIHNRQATTMDPMLRVLFETVIEALIDAGINPSDLEDTNTGVFIGSCASETENHWFFRKLITQGFAVLGCQRSMQSRRISYFLKLKGPSIICDTACSSSLHAVEHAYKAIRTGQCDRAIVGGTNLCLHPFVSLQFARLGVLSADGKCKSFDNSGNGYVRAEAISAIIIQKSSEAKRNYSTILHAKTNCDGYKDSGITYPSGNMQVRLLEEFYEECDIVKPADLSFLEAHGTGTTVGDPEELAAIEEVFLKERKNPLPIGSVKSNIGHSEPSSGLGSITKAIIAFETGYIPPNLHYNVPRTGIKPLVDGRLKVVTEKIPFTDNRGLIGISSFGFGGANCHVLLKHNTKQKLNHGRPKDNIPRIVCVSGRTSEAVNVLLDDVCKNHLDSEHIRLLQDVFRKNVRGHLYRGYSIVAKSGEILRSCKFNDRKMPKLVVCFGIINDSIMKEARAFLEMPVVADLIQRIQEVLSTKGLNISKILSNQKDNTILETTLARFSIQMVLADILKALNIIPDKIFGLTKGLSLGTLVCAYFDEALSLREVVECAYAIACAANLTGANDGNDGKELATLLEKSGKVALLHQDLKKILAKPPRLSNKVIFEVTPSEISSTNLINSFGNTKILSYVKSVLESNTALFEIGNGYINTMLMKDLGHLDRKYYVSTGGEFDNVLSSIGRLYELGYNPQVQKLFPKVEFPVSRGTPMISPKIKWNHSRKWWISRSEYGNEMKTEQTTFGIHLLDPDFAFLEGHVIDGRNLFPATGYLQLVWETLSQVYGIDMLKMEIVFENCKFRRACSLPKEARKLNLVVLIQRGSGNFEIIEGGVVVVSGRITQSKKNKVDLANIPTLIFQGTSMGCKDIYKELRLRGYNYKGQFRGITSLDVSGQVGEIVWDGNWITFMDNMMQMTILQEDTRLLYVPTTIRRITIDANKHIEYVKTFDKEKPNLPVYVSKDAGIIRSGFIEIRGLNATSIARRKHLATPVLEKYIFVPNIAKLKMEQAIRVNMQILLENLYSIKVKAVELIDKIASTGLQPLGEIINNVLADQPLIQPNIIEIIDEKPEKITEVDCSLVVGYKILQRKDILNVVFGLLNENGFILSREQLDFDVTSFSNQEITIVTVFSTDQEKLVFFRKTCQFTSPTMVRVSAKDNQFRWLSSLKGAVENDSDVLVYSQGEPLNGVLGLVACIRRESGGQKVKLVFVQDDSAPEFDINLPFYQEQLKKNLAINVLKKGQWGTYRHLLLEEGGQVEIEHVYLNNLVTGDLSSLKWIEGPLRSNIPVENQSSLIYVYYAALNFKDVMAASGRINVDTITRDRREQECVQGIEFAGRTQNGKRVMGMVENGACASLVKTNKNLLWDVPADWSLAEAATVPVVYGTCMYALFGAKSYGYKYNQDTEEGQLTNLHLQNAMDQDEDRTKGFKKHWIKHPFLLEKKQLAAY